MARARAAENLRSRSKSVLIEEITRGIGKFEEVLAAIDDFSQEGFPYRDAARAKAELQLRECVRRIFGERSPEFQTYRNHKLRTSNMAEVVQSIAVIKGLMKTLEDKKLELQGLRPLPIADPITETSPATTPHMTLVPPTAQIMMAPQPASVTPPMTLSVAMTTNLGTPIGSPTATPPSALPVSSAPQISEPSPAPPIAQSPASPEPSPTPATAPTAQSAPAPREEPMAAVTPTPPRTNSPAPAGPALHDGNAPVAQTPVAATTFPSSPTPVRSEIFSTPSAPAQDESAIQEEAQGAAPAAPVPSPSISDDSPAVQRRLKTRSIQPASEQEPLQLLRKVCLRFHSVARQLRLRKDYRATLEVEDDYDLQDLLCALLKVEFDEVGTDEWIPPYTEGAPRTTLFLNRDQIAVVAKKTRPGLTTKVLADQVAADSAYYRAQDKCTVLFCFIYDPEGRIGSPKRLETNLTSVSERCTVEVLVAPK